MHGYLEVAYCTWYVTPGAIVGNIASAKMLLGGGGALPAGGRDLVTLKAPPVIAYLKCDASATATVAMPMKTK